MPGIGSRLARQLVTFCGSAEAVFRLPRRELLKVPGVRRTVVNAIRSHRHFEEAEKELNKAERENVAVLSFTDKAFPARLRGIEDSPAILYVKGNTNLNAGPTVGIVGTRECTSYGRDLTTSLVEGLVPHRAMIISGLAYGIDIHAHKAALKNNLSTIGVLGSGIDIIYPAAHKEVAHKMINQGAIITENQFGTKPDAHNFPARNRIIAGLCDALLVIEAAAKGGALITAEIANSYNKDVFAVPGNVGNMYSEGCNKLIQRNKAHLLTSIADLEYIMNWPTDIPPQKEGTLPLFEWNTLEENEQKVMTILKDQSHPVSLDELSFQSSIALSKLASVLLSLEFRKLIDSLPGKQFRLTRPGKR